MRNFNYTVRDKTGATKSGCVQASNRKAALQELKAQNFVPLSVQDESVLKKSITDKQILLKCSKVALAVVVALSVIVYAWTYIGVTKPKIEPDKKISQHFQPQKDLNASSTGAKAKVIVKMESPQPFMTNTVAERLKPVRTNSLEYHIARQEGRADDQGNMIPKPRAFKSGTEQILNMIINKQLGDVPPPLPLIHMSERTNIVAILSQNIIVYDEDGEKSVQQKANVAQAKQLMKEYIDKGGTPEDFLRFYRDELTKAHQEWLTIEKTLIGLSTTDPEAALKYAEEQGKILTEKGMKPLIMPTGLKLKNP